MFDKFKDLYNLRQQAKEMQAALGSERAIGTSRDGSITITMNGSFDVLEVAVSENAELTKASVEKGVKEAFADAQQKIKGILMQKFKNFA